MDGIGPIVRLRVLIVPVVLTAIGASGCARDRSSARRIAPFGSIQTYSSTVVPGPAGHPRGKMIAPQAPGIDLVRRSDSIDPQTMDPNFPAVDLSTRPAAAMSPR